MITLIIVCSQDPRACMQGIPMKYILIRMVPEIPWVLPEDPMQGELSHWDQMTDNIADNYSSQ